MRSSEFTRLAAHPVGVALLSLLLSLPAQGQADAGRVSREREALRRSQAALSQLREQHATLEREKAELSVQRDQFGDAAKRAESQLAASRSEALRTRAELARLTAELASLRSQGEADRNESQLQVKALASQLDEANRSLAERARTVASLANLLERATLALAAAEVKNREMYAFGLQMIDRIRGQATADVPAQDDPVLGFGKVQLENQAEELRDRLEALRLVKAPAAK